MGTEMSRYVQVRVTGGWMKQSILPSSTPPSLSPSAGSASAVADVASSSSAATTTKNGDPGRSSNGAVKEGVNDAGDMVVAAGTMVVESSSSSSSSSPSAAAAAETKAPDLPLQPLLPTSDEKGIGQTTVIPPNGSKPGHAPGAGLAPGQGLTSGPGLAPGPGLALLSPEELRERVRLLAEERYAFHISPITHTSHTHTHTLTILPHTPLTPSLPHSHSHTYSLHTPSLTYSLSHPLTYISLFTSTYRQAQVRYAAEEPTLNGRYKRKLLEAVANSALSSASTKNKRKVSFPWEAGGGGTMSVSYGRSPDTPLLFYVPTDDGGLRVSCVSAAPQPASLHELCSTGQVCAYCFVPFLPDMKVYSEAQIAGMLKRRKKTTKTSKKRKSSSLSSSHSQQGQRLDILSTPSSSYQNSLSML